MQEFLDFFGHGFCHQIHERTLEVGGLYFSACARDTGIYLGLVLTVAIIVLLYCRLGRPRTALPSGLPPKPVFLIVGGLVLVMAVDGVTSYLHLRETTNLIRFFTGYGAGMGIGLVACCTVLGMLRGSSDSRRVLAEPRLMAVVLAASASLAAGFWLLYPYLPLVAPLLAVLVFLLLLTMINALILSITRRFGLPIDQASTAAAFAFQRQSKRRWLAVLGLAIGLALAEIALMGLVRDAVFGVLLGGSADSFQELLEQYFA